MAIIFDGHHIVGGDPGDRVAPDFRLREFERANGTVRVHRELVSALQVLRDRFGASVRIADMASGPGGARTGLFAWVSARDPAALERAGRTLAAEGYFREVRRDGRTVFLDVGDPERLPPISPAQTLQATVQVTAGFETSGDPFQQVTGNFDGAGLSFGPSQVNFGTGTLVPLFRAFQEADEAALAACFTPPERYGEWLAILGADPAEQVAWADRLSRGARKHGFARSWKACLQAVGRVAVFRDIMTGHAVSDYGARLARALRWLHALEPLDVDHLTCLSALYDLCTQQGSLDKAHEQIRARVAAQRPGSQFELVRIAVVERGLTANPRWRADCVSRRLTILNRQPTAFTADGVRARRTNRNVYLLRNVRIDDAAALRRA
ncbi:MAG: hypothetical protein PVG98_04835 [Chromatiales bacterium]|jgi:hypothetical protein